MGFSYGRRRFDMNAELETISDVFKTYPPEQWFDKCLEKNPAIDKGALMNMIEIELGGDAVEVEDDG